MQTKPKNQKKIQSESGNYCIQMNKKIKNINRERFWASEKVQLTKQTNQICLIFFIAMLSMCLAHRYLFITHSLHK